MAAFFSFAERAHDEDDRNNAENSNDAIHDGVKQKHSIHLQFHLTFCVE
jgi:hypothetical protein